MIRLIAALAAAALAASPAAAKLNVFACEPEWAALSQEIGGANVDVYTATLGGQDPHQVQARPSLIAKARAADIAVCTGAELEIGWMPLIQQQASNAKIASGSRGFFEATSVVQLLETPTSLDRAQGDLHAYGNPHIQTDPRYMVFVSKALAARFAELDPKSAPAYRAGSEAFAAKMNAKIAEWQAKAAPLRGAPIAVQHRSWIYLIKWLGLREVVALEPKPGVPPSSGYLAQVLDTLKQQPVKVIIRAAYEDPRPSEFVAGRTGRPAVALPFTVGGTAGAKDLVSLYDETIRLMLEANAKP